MSHRIDRVNELLKREIGTVVQKDYEWNGALVTVNAVETTQDIKEAKVWVGVLGGRVDAVLEKLNHDHGYIKTYLYELLEMPKDSPAWIVKLRELRTLVEEHVREEEDDIYPAFHARQSDEQNARLTALLNKEGFSYN